MCGKYCTQLTTFLIMTQTHTLSNEPTHLSWDSLLILLFIAFVYYVIGRFISNIPYSLYYFGCAMGILQCIFVHQSGLYLYYFLANHGDVDFARLFGHIQLAPYTPQILSGSDTDEEDYSDEDSDSEHTSDDETDKKSK